MKRFLMYSLVALLGMATLSCSREDGADGINGINGIDGINGKTILSGKGEPSTSLGTIGDFYLNLDNYNLYGPKSEQGWGNPISLIGAKGDKGEDGKDGADGQNGADGKDGKDGADGKNGADGRDGVDGKDAPKIWTGETAPTSSIGNEGDFYLDLKNKVLYGPKTNGSWGEGIVLKNSLKGSYILSADGKTLHQWLDKNISFVDMEADAELRNVTRIGNGAFEYSELTQIVLPKGLEYIGRNAFRYSKLTTIEIPNNVKYIGQQAFRGNDLTTVAILGAVENIEVGTFMENKITNLYMPESVVSIGGNAFSYNQLENVVIPRNVTSIGNSAFLVNKLLRVDIPNGVKYIGNNAFQNNKLSSIVLPENIKSIGLQAFWGNELQSIEFPSKIVEIERIGSSAFSQNFQLTSIIMKSSTPPRIVEYNYGITNIFDGDISRITLYVPEGSGEAYRDYYFWKGFYNIVEQ